MCCAFLSYAFFIAWVLTQNPHTPLWFFGILGGPLLGALLWGIIVGAIFGMIFAAVPYGLSGGDRDFTSHTQIIAGRYDVLCAPDHATRARDMIAQMGVAPRHSPQEDPAPRPEEGDGGPQR